MQQPVGEHMPALGISGELNFVDREEIDRHIARHRLDGAYPVPRRFRLDFFFTRDERDIRGTNPGYDLVIHLAGKQPQRQPDHPAFVAEHPLDSQMGLAGVRWTQNRGNVADAGI